MQNTWWYWLPGTFMLFLLSVFYYQFYNLLNPDLLAYFSVGRHYQNLDLKEAFNSYWSPLICWLLALMPGLKSDPMTAFRWINIGVALAIYYQLYFWIRLVIRENSYRFGAAILAAVFLSGHALCIGSPDFLSLFSFLLFLRLVIKKDSSVKHSILLALSILLCFFSKTFLLALCVVTLFSVWGYTCFEKKKLPGLKSPITLVVMVCAGLLIWASCLRLHYGRFILSSVVTYNTSEASQEAVHLMPPPSEKALFVWEDPYYIQVASEYSGDLKMRIAKLFDRWQYNWNISVYYFKYISWLWFGILLIPVAGIFLTKNRRNKIGLLLFFVFVFNWLGYFSIIMQERYLLIGQFLLYLSVLGFSERLLSNGLKRIRFNNPLLAGGLFSLILLSMIKNPIQESYREWKNYTNTKNEIGLAYKISESGILKGKRIATYKESEQLYNVLSLACFLSGGQYYGEMNEMNKAASQEAEAMQTKLDILVSVDLIGEKCCENKEWLKGKKVLFVLKDLTFYDVSN